jgi:hypothetical protein
LELAQEKIKSAKKQTENKKKLLRTQKKW